MKSVIWIDDRKDSMLCIIRGVFPTLWEKGIISKVVFLGDAIYDDINEIDPCDFSYQISDMFFVHYKNLENVPTPNISVLHQMCEHYESEHSDVFVLKPTPNSTISNIMEFWKQNQLSTDCLNNKMDEIMNDIDSLFCTDETHNDIIPSNSENLYMLDVVLLKDDYNKLTSTDPKPVLSIALYNYITNVLNAKCILFSQYTYNSMLQKNWKKLYKEIYNDIRVEIVPRTKYYEGSQDKTTIEAITNHFEVKTEAEPDGH